MKDRKHVLVCFYASETLWTFTCDIRLDKSNWNEFYERLMFTATEKKEAAAFLEIMKLLLKKESTNLHLAWNSHETTLN